ncbi:hypothetical protein I5M32_06795 [Pedobacter sp. SD-b]|uniref:Uncharacterized protein n=1 Tax=Pedobacter segetis TaxID=2793069 RepID=A0ABS1BIE8_9SPHI|nr:hypothetical protein [Pedobacter segetis]MBK0382666.1 hypothetical protein [Pedobacter segetis]
MYRYRALIFTLLIGSLINVIASFGCSLLVRTILLELSLIAFFLALFSKRKNREEGTKNHHHDDLKIHF